MAITIPAALSISSQNGFSAVAFDTEVDSAQSSRAKQVAVTGLNTGTAPGDVVYHSISNPFTVTVERPAQFKSLGVVNPITGRLGNVPRNVFKFRTRKGVVPLSGQSPVIMVIETSVSIPAGADLVDSNNVRAAFGAHGGTINQISVELGDMLIDGVL